MAERSEGGGEKKPSWFTCPSWLRVKSSVEQQQDTSLKLYETYGRLASTAAVNGSIGGSAGYLLFSRLPRGRWLGAGLGAGLLMGWNLQQANDYLKDPREAKLPRTVLKSTADCFKNCCDDWKKKK